MLARFIIPGPLATISGGYGYDREIIAGLRDLGHPIEVSEIGDPLAALNLPGLPIIDGLALPAFAPLAAEIAAKPCVGLIHHPISLEPDMAHLGDLERALFPAFARVIVTSDWTAKALVEQFSVAAERIHVVQPGTATAPRLRTGFCHRRVAAGVGAGIGRGQGVAEKRRASGTPSRAPYSLR